VQRDSSSSVKVSPQKLLLCPGCCQSFPDLDGPMHPYIGASAGCWDVYGRILAREFEEFQYPGVHRLTVDAYAVQHPGVSSRRSAQSVWVHLAALYLILEQGVDFATVTAKLRVILAANSAFEWLEPPAERGKLSVLDLEGAADLPDHASRVQQWATSVWNAWEQYHGRVASIARSVL
jgi:hypothetical protein